MLESYLGESTFHVGINAYLEQHAYANATAADLWNALSNASHKPIDKLMATFVEQPGIPLLSRNEPSASALLRNWGCRKSDTHLIAKGLKPAAVNSGKFPYG